MTAQRYLARALAVVALLATALALPIDAPAGATDEIRPIVFPIEGPHHYTDTFGACRGAGCSRSHEGIDIMADKMLKAVAARDATVKWIRDDATPDGSRGNYIMLIDDDGWEYWYIHLNNDTPGTDDGANDLQHVFAPGIERGARVEAGQHIAYVGDSGNAEWTAPHIHFEIHRPDGSILNPYASLRAAQAPMTDPYTQARSREELQSSGIRHDGGVTFEANDDEGRDGHDHAFDDLHDHGHVHPEGGLIHDGPPSDAELATLHGRLAALTP